jgi:phosphopantetheinyl transferase (holo-ACP synthase)
MDEVHERRSSDRAVENLRRECDYRFASIDQRFAAQEMAVVAALAAAKEAVIKAEMAQEKRFDQVSIKIDTLTTYMDKLAGKAAGQAITMGYMIAAATLVISVMVLLSNVVFK